MKHLFSASTLWLLLTSALMISCGKEEPPMVEFQSDATEAWEGENTNVSFNIPLPAGVTPDFNLSGTAEETTDFTYEISSSGLVFTTVDDGIYDPDETIIITLTQFNGDAVLGAKKTHILTIKETPLTVEFQTATGSRIEGQSIVAAFNQSLPAGVAASYKITGTAEATVDYIITPGSNGFVVAAKKDELYDNGKTVIIELTSITGNAVLGSNKIYTLTLVDEDETELAGLRINLTWEATDLLTSDVDVDLLVWRETAPGVYTAQGGLWSAIIGTAPEFTFIPANEPDGTYAISYVYFNGTSNNLKVKADFRSFKGNINTTSNRASYSKTYTLVNLNTYADPYTVPLVVAQTLTKTGGNVTNLTDITVATSGSRTSPVQFILDDKARSIIEAKRSAKSSGLN